MFFKKNTIAMLAFTTAMLSACAGPTGPTGPTGLTETKDPASDTKDPASDSNNPECSCSCPDTLFSGPSIQVSEIAMIPTMLLSPIYFSSAKNPNTGVMASNITVGPNVWVATAPSSLIGNLATLNPSPGPVSFTGADTTLGLPMTASFFASTTVPSPGLAYADFGRLLITNTITGMSPTAVTTHSAFSGGKLLTPAMPSGTAAQVGRLTGILANSTVGGPPNFFNGDVSLSINYAAGTITATMTNLVIEGGATTFNDLTLNGTISGNGFTGSVTAGPVGTDPLSFTPGASGATLLGNFRGPSAVEANGSFTIVSGFQTVLVSFGTKL